MALVVLVWLSAELASVLREIGNAGPASDGCFVLDARSKTSSSAEAAARRIGGGGLADGEAAVERRERKLAEATEEMMAKRSKLEVESKEIERNLQESRKVRGVAFVGA